ncbi:serine/threonine/tyrosine-protein kinase HT1-like [Zingiber officinale]|uniref:serine/threonine/tyrosine-protein kinase HT1-like n=1 Tax=Zingiber officinale TaxID=94328 RepID=UPI001C4DB025|nr:serine/threonine/tyrosine-protein kinase HT1-like [Zingiber officinale]XP_042411644.1 serine/threonine/tyrosine-protein kinase HT1-like [Zingiber officinale]XP_042411645.1 serine/threonine/tyrosine-protein kinase HT1-like [Zingiber officinale]
MEEEHSSWVLRSTFGHITHHARTRSVSERELLAELSKEPGDAMSFHSNRFPPCELPSKSSIEQLQTQNSRKSLNFRRGDPLDGKRPSSLSADNSDFSFYPEGIPALISDGSISADITSSRFPLYDFKAEGRSSKVVAASSSRVKLDAKQHCEQHSKPKERSISPLPTTNLSEAFKEARLVKKRSSTPPPSKKKNDKARGNHEVFWRKALEKSHHTHSSSFKTLDKSGARKESSWAGCFDHGGGRVAALEMTEKWNVDLCELYFGLKFASGAHSRLYHGIYKGQPVAIKIIRQPDDEDNGLLAARLEKQFTREVSMLSHLYHRNVIKLTGACKQPQAFCIITEYLPGGSLRAFMHKLEHKSLALEKLISMALEIARGMEYIHSQGVIHRDLKPENIIFDQDFCIKIVDFGIACEEAYCDALTEDDGTYRWMAPEMIKHKPYGRKVDVYSFGLLLWEMTAGKIPYEEMTPIQAAFAVVDKNLRPPIPTDCPRPLQALIEQCWSILPEKRPEFWQIVKVLEQFEATLSQDGTLNKLQNLSCQDHKKQLIHWMQKLKTHSHSDSSGASMPKLM